MRPHACRLVQRELETLQEYLANLRGHQVMPYKVHQRPHAMVHKASLPHVAPKLGVDAGGQPGNGDPCH